MRHAWFVIVALATSANAAPRTAPVAAAMHFESRLRLSVAAKPITRGSGASRDWFKHGWIVKDYQHPTSEGATRIADALYQALVAN